ncbi:uncharacterized protein LOC126970832 [Leptidea sinapis]|uniref:uncharacterized protein LOC126970832 n=1 Tax=Leptidea sinapis TaxID=189913 RepID=UPI002138E223|nr:uncharacterized protein LOC126970832 [Leptidea sinapis]
MDNNASDTLHSNVLYFIENHSAIEPEIRKLVSDNQALSKQVEELLKEKLQHEEYYGNNQSIEVQELRRQVGLLTKERDSLHVLWQTSQKTIEALETELKTYQHCDDRVGKQSIACERRGLEMKLDTALADYMEIEKQYKKLHSDRNILEKELKTKEKHIFELKEKCNDLEDKVAELNKTLDECKVVCLAEKKSNEDMKSQLALCRKELVEKTNREGEAKLKVAEALQLFDFVSAQKTEALKTVSDLKEELTKVKNSIAAVSREAEESYRREIDGVKERYNEKVTDMLEHVKCLDSELVEKGILLNKALRENKILQASNESLIIKQNDNIKALDPKLALAEEKLEAIFQDLVASERRNMQLACEKQALAMDMQRVQDWHARELKRRDWEHKLLEGQCEELKLQVNHLEKSLDESRDMVNKMQEMLAARIALSQKVVSTKEQELVELKKHLESQMELNNKWKESYVDMTEKMKKKFEELYEENKHLKSLHQLPSNSSTESVII